MAKAAVARTETLDRLKKKQTDRRPVCRKTCRQTTMDVRHNPNAWQLLAAVEGITSPDGRVLGKIYGPFRAQQRQT